MKLINTFFESCRVIVCYFTGNCAKFRLSFWPHLWLHCTSIQDLTKLTKCVASCQFIPIWKRNPECKTSFLWRVRNFPKNVGDFMPLEVILVFGKWQTRYFKNMFLTLYYNISAWRVISTFLKMNQKLLLKAFLGGHFSILNFERNVLIRKKHVNGLFK